MEARPSEVHDPEEAPLSRNEQRALETRLEILEAASELFAERGYHGVSVRDIASLARVSEALLYHHFGNKAQLLESVLFFRLERLGEALQSVIAPSAEQPKSLEHLLARAFDQLYSAMARPELRKFLRLVILCSDLLPEQSQQKFVSELHAKLWDPATQLLAALLPQSKGEPTKPYAFFRMLQGSFMGYALFQEILGWKEFIELDPVEYRDTVTRVLARGVLAGGKSP